MMVCGCHGLAVPNKMKSGTVGSRATGPTRPQHTIPVNVAPRLGSRLAHLKVMGLLQKHGTREKPSLTSEPNLYGF